MTSELMNMVAPKQLYKVVGIAVHAQKGLIHVDEGQLYAATNIADATSQANEFWTDIMGFDTFNGYAKLIDRVDGYKVVLVADEQA